MPKGAVAAHRMIRLTATGGGGIAGVVRVLLEDDYHHFRVTIEHDGQRVRATHTQAGRRPYSLCDQAGAQLEQMVGLALCERMSDVFRGTDPRQQCTHQLDMAALAVAVAARGTKCLRYDLLVPNREQGRTVPWALRDEREVLRWEIDGDRITSPEPYAGLGTGGGFTDWVATRLAPLEAEAALLLRRAVFVSLGRTTPMNMDVQHAPATQACWVKQPARNTLALRRISSWQDITRRPDELSETDEAWIGFDDGPGR
jgi:hypothetical protein